MTAELTNIASGPLGTKLAAGDFKAPAHAGQGLPFQTQHVSDPVRNRYILDIILRLG